MIIFVHFYFPFSVHCYIIIYKLVFIEVEYYKGNWWYINFKNERSWKYNSINEAIADISNMFGDWIDFKLLA